MGKRLTNNLGLKVISVFLAFFVWLAVVNIANPETEGAVRFPWRSSMGRAHSNGKTYEIIGDVDTVVVSYKIRVQDSGACPARTLRPMWIWLRCTSRQGRFP